MVVRASVNPVLEPILIPRQGHCYPTLASEKSRKGGKLRSLLRPDEDRSLLIGATNLKCLTKD